MNKHALVLVDFCQHDRGYILSLCQFEHVIATIDEDEMIRRSLFHDVPGEQKSIRIEEGRCRFWSLEVSRDHVIALDAQFASRKGTIRGEVAQFGDVSQLVLLYGRTQHSVVRRDRSPLR